MSIEGCLLGCAVGDSIGLPFEGMKPKRIAKLWPEGTPLSHRFVFGRGMVSDDTDHSVFVAQAMSKHPTDPEAFARCLGWKLRFWLLCLPAGIGMATLRSILKLWIGFPPNKSGVFSAGNGAAMRSAVIGARFAHDPELRRAFVSASSRITHSDPAADFGAQAVAALATGTPPSLAELQQLLSDISDDKQWGEVVSRIVAACESGLLADALPAGVADRGVTGYVYHTVPVAIAAWHIHHGDFRATIESVIRLGGDTDTVAAIAGALAGASLGREGIPDDWLNRIADFPHGTRYLSQLANADEGAPRRFSAWLAPRGLVFTLIVIGHGFRRLLPPY